MDFVQQPADAALPRLSVEPFAVTEAGEAVERLYPGQCARRARAVPQLWRIVTAIHCPDRAGKMENIVLGFPTLRDYEPARGYFGALIGRYANRIADGRFVLEGEEYHACDQQSAECAAWRHHKASTGRSGQVELREAEGQAVLRYTSEDGEEGYPGQGGGYGDLHADRHERIHHPLSGEHR